MMTEAIPEDSDFFEFNGIIGHILISCDSHDHKRNEIMWQDAFEHMHDEHIYYDRYNDEGTCYDDDCTLLTKKYHSGIRAEIRLAQRTECGTDESSLGLNALFDDEKQTVEIRYYRDTWTQDTLWPESDSDSYLHIESDSDSDPGSRLICAFTNKYPK